MGKRLLGVWEIDGDGKCVGGLVKGGEYDGKNEEVVVMGEYVNNGGD